MKKTAGLRPAVQRIIRRLRPSTSAYQEKANEGMHAGTWDGRNPQMPVVKGINSYIDKDSIRKTTGIFVPKILLFLADELKFIWLGTYK